MNTKLAKKSTTKITPATKARSKKPVDKTMIEPPIVVQATDDFKPNKKYIKSATNEVSSSSWWLDNVVMKIGRMLNEFLHQKNVKKLLRLVKVVHWLVQ